MTATKQQRLAKRAGTLPGNQVTEAEYQAWILERATEAGWTLQFHVLRSQVKGGRWVTNTSSPGVPDVWLLRPSTGELVVLEVKRHRGKPTTEQLAWVAGLQKVPGVEAFIVGPADALEVLDLLARPRQPESATLSVVRSADPDDQGEP